MAGVLIYKGPIQYFSFVVFDDTAYEAAKATFPEGEDQILWERANVSIQQIDAARLTKDALVKRLNEGETIDLEKELSAFFP